MVSTHLSWHGKIKVSCVFSVETATEALRLLNALFILTAFTIKFSVCSLVCLSHSSLICCLANCSPGVGIHGWSVSILRLAFSCGFVYATGIGEIYVRLSVGCHFFLTLKMFASEMIVLKHNCLGCFSAWKNTLLALPRTVWCEKHH